jgi:MinD-like ATPase involved in chromosome partitioning or flagellar assembly
MRRLYPETPLLHGVEQHIADARVQYRHSLEAKFLESAEKNNIEQAMELLKELDRYLTPDEAREFMETADAVITKYRETLSTRFKMAVSDRRWTEAIGFGEAISTQFPNTTMAKEVRELLETIHTRAEEDEAAI